MHRIRVARSILRVFEVGFVQDDENALGHVPVELIELMLRKDGAGGVIGVGEVNDLGAIVDRAGERGEIVVPVAIGYGAVSDAARFRQHLKTNEGGFGGEYLVLI